MLLAAYYGLLLLIDYHSSSIVPDQTFPIVLTSTNSQDTSKYTFAFTSTVSLDSDCFLTIAFPNESYLTGMGLDFSPQVDLYSNGTLIQSNLATQLNDYSLVVYPTSISVAVAYQIVIQGVLNPSTVGGTSSFGLSASCGSQLIMNNTIFTSIAITDPKVLLQSASLSIKSGSTYNAGEKAVYRLTFVPSKDISIYTSFHLIFPSTYDFSSLIQTITDFPSQNPCSVVQDVVSGYIPTGNFTCTITDSTVIIAGLSKPIPKSSTVVFDISGVLNPALPGQTQFFQLRAMLLNSYHTYQYDDTIEGKLNRRGYCARCY